ncbi:MAG: hypothetical protein GC154_01775 [bacterium]|nr:hypothetical protein [bacterium]
MSIVSTDRFGEKGNGLGPEYQYDLSELRKTDPAMILYKEASPRINTGHSWGRAIAVGPEDQIYTLGGQQLHVFDSTGKRLPLTIERDKELTAVTVLKDGSIYLGVTDHIEIFDASGQLKSQWESIGSGAEITSIVVTPDIVFAADFGSRSVIRYDASGQKLDSFGDFNLPSNYFDLAYTSDGQLLAANTGEHRIETYDLKGNLMSWWGEFSNQEPDKFCGCCNPISFALLPGQSGIVTCEKGLTRVKVYDKEGRFVGFVAGAESFDQRDGLTATPEYCYNRMGLDVAVDSQGRVLVLEPVMAEIRVYQRINTDNSSRSQGI